MQARVIVVLAVMAVLAAATYGIVKGETSAVVTLAGATVAAGVAAYTAQIRLERQLAAERERHELTLRHDRDAAALAELRIVLDEAAVAVQDLEKAVGAIGRTFDAAGQQRALRRGKRRALADARSEVRALVVRLWLRLGRDHETVQALQVLVERAREIHAAATRLHLPPSDPASDRIVLDHQIAGFYDEVRAFRLSAVTTTDGLAARLGSSGPAQAAVAPSAAYNAR